MHHFDLCLLGQGQLSTVSHSQMDSLKASRRTFERVVNKRPTFYQDKVCQFRKINFQQSGDATVFELRLGHTLFIEFDHICLALCSYDSGEFTYKNIPVIVQHLNIELLQV